MTVQANDRDKEENGTVRFRFEPNSITPDSFPHTQYYPYFEIDDKGTIRTIASFDRERVSEYTAQVVAYDEGKPSLSSTYICHKNIFTENA